MAQMDEREPSLGEMDDFDNKESKQKNRLIGYIAAGITLFVLILMTLQLVLQ
ncbi:MAG: hypothetical protein AB7E49_00215 [Campylobacterales bacterium]